MIEFEGAFVHSLPRARCSQRQMLSVATS